MVSLRTVKRTSMTVRAYMLNPAVSASQIANDRAFERAELVRFSIRPLIDVKADDNALGGRPIGSSDEEFVRTNPGHLEDDLILRLAPIRPTHVVQ